MLWVPQKGILRVEHNAGTVGNQSIGTSVISGAAASTKGTAVELITATSFDAYMITVMASNYSVSATASEGALDILTGAATEDVLIPNLLMGNTGNPNNAGRGPKIWTFPLYIPAGTRIAAQCAGALLTTTMKVAVWLHGGAGYPPFRVGSKVTTYGMGTVPNGTALTPGASGAAGTYTQITAATSEDNFAFLPSFQCATDTTMNARALLVDIGIGAATEETIGSWWFASDANETMDGPWPNICAFQDVPSGTRLAMRASNGSTNDAAYNGVIHAVS